MASDASSSAFRRLWRRLGTSDADMEAAELQESSRTAGAKAIDHCACGEVVTVAGPLRSVTLTPVAGVPSVEAELYDGTGKVMLMWMGRRRIHGIEPGRVLTATGRMNLTEGNRVIYNPRYTLRPNVVGE